MKTMANLWLMILVLALHYSVPTLSAVITQRNLLQFNNMISHKGYNSMDYIDYGCWCGLGGAGTWAIDDTDFCCHIHDQCYGRISEEFVGCSPKLATYAWKGRPNNVIECTDPIGTCDLNLCECDKAAADCFAMHRSTYNPDFFNINQDVCYTRNP